MPHGFSACRGVFIAFESTDMQALPGLGCASSRNGKPMGWLHNKDYRLMRVIFSITPKKYGGHKMGIKYFEEIQSDTLVSFVSLVICNILSTGVL